MVPMGELCPPPSWPWATSASSPTGSNCFAWRTVPITASTFVPRSRSRSSHAAGLPSPEA